jgi:hypothetical protein
MSTATIVSGPALKKSSVNNPVPQPISSTRFAPSRWAEAEIMAALLFARITPAGEFHPQTVSGFVCANF